MSSPPAAARLDDTHQSLRVVRPPTRDAEQLARVVVLAGERAGRKLTVNVELAFGRSRGVGLQLDDGQVSRRHGRIGRGPNGWFIEDLGSRNGTSLNGTAVTGVRDLAFGDRIQVGESLLLFTHHDPLEEHILERQKLEAIGRLGTGIAHDFNNLLGAVHSSLDYLDRLGRDRTLDDADVQACVADIRTAASRATEMTRRLLGFARRSNRSHSAVNLSKLAAEVLKLLERTLGRQVDISGDVGGQFIVPGDRSHLHQLLMNLCINARDALAEEGGRLAVRVYLASEDELTALPFRDHREYIVLSVEDDGVGMDEDTQSRLFEPFFTTKREGHGAGLGLATAYEVVDAHGGHIDVQSELGSGTTFRVFLPRFKGGKVDTERLVKVGALRQSGPPLQVLVVDDEAVMRRSVVRLLHQLGHSVEQAENGQEALAMFDAAPRKPDLVMLDLDMPMMRGDETFRALRQRDPNQSVIIVSGYIDEQLKGALEDEGALAVLHKPFDVAALQAVLTGIPPRSE